MKSTQKLWLLAIAVTLLTLLLTLCASAETYSGSCGANADWSFDTETGVLTISGTGAMDAYENTTMPWYNYRTQVKSIVIENGITSIGKRAFSECAATTVTIADSVTEIGGYAFRECQSVTDIHIGSGVTFIGEFAINNWKSIKSLTIPGNVKKLEHNAINNCSELTSLTLEEGIEIIPYQAITGCKALTELEVPASAKTFGTKGKAPSAVEKCTGLTKITFKSAGTAIYGTLPTATSITLYAPANSTAQAYADANKDDKVTFVALADEPSQSIGGTCGATAVWSFDPTTGVLKISGTGAMDAYENTTMPWYNYRTQVKSIVIENGITSIGKRAFSECAATSVEIADSVTVINGYAFRVCHNITDIKIGKGVLAIDEHAFNELLSLESIVIPGNVKKINKLVFNNCKKLSSVTIEEGVETILNDAFYNCISLKEIILPSTLKSIGNIKGDSAFTKCTALEKVTFLSKDTAIYPDSEAGIPDTATVYCYKGSAAEAYADKYGREKVTFPFAIEKTTAFALTAGAVKAEAGKLLPIASLKRQSLTAEYGLDLLLVDENGALLVRTADGDTEALFNSNGEALLLADNTDIVIIYNDQNGKARFYVNRQYPLMGAELKPAVGIEIADEKLPSSFVFSEELVLANDVLCVECKEIEDSPALFAGFQTNEDKTAIRIFSGINTLYYDSIGFEISLYVDDELKGSKTESISTVFSSIINDSEKVSAEKLGFSYLALAEIHHVNRGDYPDSSLVYFKIKPFSTIGGEKLYDIETTITVTNENGENRFVN